MNPAFLSALNTAARSTTTASTKAEDLAAPRISSAGSGASASSSKAQGASTITASDFLTLLVSELKNQDPTQPQDPNAYIQQLVGVNSLQQLIQINQNVTTLSTTTAAGSSTTTTPAY